MTLDEMARKLREANPRNEPMYLQWMAEQWWPGADWITVRCSHGGARRGGMAAAGFAARLAKRGLLVRHAYWSGGELRLSPVAYTWKKPPT